MNTIGDDGPLEREDQDQLERLSMAQRLARSLYGTTRTSKGTVIGLTGSWGTGKSTLLNFVELELKKNPSKPTVIRFNPWAFSNQHDLINQFFVTLTESFTEIGKTIYGTRSDQLVDALIDLMKEYGESISPALDLAYPGASIAWAGGALALKLRKRNQLSLLSQKKKICDALNQIDISIIVIMDEIDRLNDDEIRNISQLVRAIADFPKISYIMAYDRERVAVALGVGESERREQRMRGFAYLEKIVSLEVPVPALTSAEAKRIVDQNIIEMLNLFEISSDIDKNDRYIELRSVISVDSLINIRRLKRSIRIFSLTYSLVMREVDWVDVLAWVYLSQIYINTSRYILDNCDLFLVDPRSEAPSSVAFISATIAGRDEGKNKYEKMVSLTGEDGPIVQALINFLFPSFTSRGSEFNIKGDQICYYYPFITLTRLGVPFSNLTSSDLYNWISKDQSDFRSSMTRVFNGGSKFNLEDFLDRWSSNYHNTWAQRVEPWTSIASMIEEAQVKTTEDVIKFEKYAEVVSAALLRVANYNDFIRSHCGSIIDNLFSNKIYFVISEVLWAHVYYCGWFGGAARDPDRGFIEQSRLGEYNPMIAHKVREMLDDEDSFRKFCMSPLRYYMLRAGLWTPVMTELFRDKLNNNFACLNSFVLSNHRPGVTLDKESINEFIDLEQYRSLMRKRSPLVSSSDQILGRAYERGLSRV